MILSVICDFWKWTKFSKNWNKQYKANQRFYLSFWRGRDGKALQSRVRDWHSSTQTWSLHRGMASNMCPSLWRRSRWSSCECPHTLSHRHQWPGLEGTHSGRSPRSWCSGRSYKCQVSDTHRCLMKRGQIMYTSHFNFSLWGEADVYRMVHFNK